MAEKSIYQSLNPFVVLAVFMSRFTQKYFFKIPNAIPSRAHQATGGRYSHNKCPRLPTWHQPAKHQAVASRTIAAQCSHLVASRLKQNKRYRAH